MFKRLHIIMSSSIAILLDNFYRRYLLRMRTILSLSACDSFLQMKFNKNLLFGCFTSVDSNFPTQHKYYSSAARNV